MVKRATLQTIASALGVHRSTVARALDPAQRDRISPETVERVTAEVARQGYRRDAIAASLRTGRSRLIGVVLTDLANPVFSAILDGVSEELTKRGYSMLVAPIGMSPDRQIEVIDALIGRRVDGLLIATATRRDPMVSYCLRQKIPTVLVNRAEDDLRVSSVVPDDRMGMTLVVDHLADSGHRYIAHIAGPDEVSTGHLRLSGFRDAMTSHALDPSRIARSARYSRGEGALAAEIILQKWPEVTAICASNDLLALGAIEHLNKVGLSCPDDVSVTGFNDMPFIDLVLPALTAVRVRQHQMGQTAARVLFDGIEGRSEAPTLERLPVTLIRRNSVASLPASLG